MGKNHLLGLMLGVLTAGLVQVPALAKQIDLLHTVPLEIQGSADARTLPEKITSADEVVSVLNSAGNLLVHMETLRRGYIDLPSTEQERLVNLLNKRYQSTSEDPVRFFDHGYAQLVYKENKTGLFFLRKANDRLKNQFTSMAYAMAQADVDLNIENGSPDAMTFRKLDVIYKMTDAVDYDARAHQNGFWPSFVRISQELKKFGPYAEFTNTDFSERYLSYLSGGGLVNGETVRVSVEESTATPPNTQKETAPSTCDPVRGYDTASNHGGGQLFRSRTLSLGTGNGTAHFYTTGMENQYKVVAVNSSNQVVGNFLSPSAPYIIEDLNGDGVDEFVIRQFLKDPFEPVKVYRFTSCGFQLDNTLANYFK